MTDPYAAGRARLARSGLTLTVAPMADGEAAFPVDVWCARTRPRGTGYGEWRAFYGPKARALVARSRVLLASTEHDGTRLALGFLALGSGDVVRLVYVKLAFRGMGIGLGLLEAAQVPTPVVVEEAEPGWKRWAAYHKLPYVVA